MNDVDGRSSPSSVRVRRGRTLAPLALLVATWCPGPAFALPPTEPRDLQALVYSDRTVELTWGRSTDDGVVRGYEVVRNGRTLGVLDALSYLDDDLVRGTEYTWTVTALDDEGERSSPASATASTGGTNGLVDGPPAATGDTGCRPGPGSAGTTADAAECDPEAPSAPTNVRLRFYTPTLAGLFWDPSPAAEQVVAVEIYRDDALIGVSERASFYDDGREAGASHAYALIAVDVDGDRSEPASVGFTETRRLVPSGDTPAYDDDKGAIAVSGDTLVIGAADEGSDYDDYDDYLAGPPSGAAYVFTRDGAGAWSQTQRLVSSSARVRTGPDAEFGRSIALDGDTLVIGERSGDAGVRGLLHVFARDAAGTWSEVQTLTARDDASTRYFRDGFGRAIALEGDTLIASAEHGQNGVVVVFTRDASGLWSRRQTLEAADTDALIEESGDSGFGRSIALDGDTAVVGGSWDWRLESAPVHVLERDAAGRWTERQRLVPTDIDYDYGDNDGIALEGDTFVMASSYGTSVTVFARGPSGDWSQTQTIAVEQGPRTIDPYSGDIHDGPTGTSVALDDGLLLAGSRYDDGLASRAGAAYLYAPDASGAWVEVRKLTASDGEPGALFGRTVALDGARALVGATARYRPDGDDDDDGCCYPRTALAYVFELPSDGTDDVPERVAGSFEFGPSSMR